MHVKPALIGLFASAATGAGVWLGGLLEPAGLPSPLMAPPPAMEQAAAPEVAPVVPAPAAEPAPAPVAESATFAEFDIVRAAPDGSLVLAGRATPNSRIDVIANDKTLATLRSDLTGSFALVLEQPLAPGDYSISLRVTPPQGDPATSLETAIVRIPDSPTGETLALIDQAGKPSEILTAGSALVPAVPVATAETVAIAEAQSGATGLPPLVPLPDLDPASVTIAAAPETAPAQPATAAPIDAPVAIVPETLAIEAVEIEDDKLFIAGQAKAGQTIRLYVGETSIGDVLTNPGGRWLFQGSVTVPAGETAIRADVVGPDGSVIARANVPFTRPDASKFAAIAVPEPNLTLPNEPPTLALQPVSNSVIIRRGDTLWQIARRVYGRGVRYSTIYGANAEQITDPNRIWPGQVFAVPEVSDDGEKADPAAIKDMAPAQGEG